MFRVAAQMSVRVIARSSFSNFAFFDIFCKLRKSVNLYILVFCAVETRLFSETRTNEEKFPESPPRRHLDHHSPSLWTMTRDNLRNSGPRSPINSPLCSPRLGVEKTEDVAHLEVVEEDIYILGMNLRGMPLANAVGLFTIGIFITYITMFIIQESVFKTSKFDSGGLLVVLTDILLHILFCQCNVHNHND